METADVIVIGSGQDCKCYPTFELLGIALRREVRTL
jgi:hypothetical protein